MSESTAICNWLYQLAHERNGENVQLELNGVSVLVIQRMEDADWVLRRNVQNYNKNMAWFRQALGASRFSENGDAWLIRKDLTQYYFSKFDRERVFELASRHAGKAIERLIASSKAGSLVIDDSLFREMAVSVLIENFFGVRFEDTGIDLQHMTDLMEYGSAYSFVPAGKTAELFREKLMLLPDLRRKVLEDFKIFREGKLPENPMLDGLLAADRDPSNDIVLEHELLTFFAAGAETTAATVGWATYLLAAYPQVQEELRQDARSFWQSGTRNWECLSKLERLSCFNSEALRLFPPSPIIARIALDADRIDDIDIQPGQNVLISFIGIQHDKRLYADPWVLNMDEGADKTKGSHRTRAGSGVSTAFSSGPRVCGGKNFALVELMSFLSVFLDRARFELTSTDAPVFYWKSQMLREGGQPVKAFPLMNNA